MAGNHQAQGEYPKQYIGAFKHDYYKHGKFNLDVQVFHLARLADFYLENYKLTRNWTHCLKAHALYNSVSARRPDQSSWRNQAFQVQQEYLGRYSTITKEQQQNITKKLKCHIETIREQSRADMLIANEFTDKFEDQELRADHYSAFYDCLEKASLSCSEDMAKLAGQVIRESISILAPAEPPCDFVAVAIGSLARGEATPYSDLEYLFVIEDSSRESIEYFERLAITSYFQITNLGETKLSYMDIKELHGWFDDVSMNGFKIDGLTAQAGNIPTGNGSLRQHNHFIVTPHELAERYQITLDNPDEKVAVTGDLTAMLTYMKPIYSHNIVGKDILEELQLKIRNAKPNLRRRSINMDMLSNDVKKYAFPSSDMSNDKADFAAHVKKEFYRFPSILLLDVTIIMQAFAASSWNLLKYLCDKQLLPRLFIRNLQFLLAAASFMRLSAYLFHDSQDDRISVAPSVVHRGRVNKPTKITSSQRRWFVTSGLYIAICKTIFIVQNDWYELKLGHPMRKGSKALADITALFRLSRHRDCLARIEKLVGDNVLDDPILYVRQRLTTASMQTYLLNIIAQSLVSSFEYETALEIFKYLQEVHPGDFRVDIAQCYCMLGELERSIVTLECIDPKTIESRTSLGIMYLQKQEYHSAELELVQAMYYEHSTLMSAVEPQYDYYGNLLKDDETHTKHRLDFKKFCDRKERIPMIIYSSESIIGCLQQLGSLYYTLGLYELSEAHLKKGLEMASLLYGEGSAFAPVAQMNYLIGEIYVEYGCHREADEQLNKALSIFTHVAQENYRLPIARTWKAKGVIKHVSGRPHEAKHLYKQALAVLKKEPTEIHLSEISDLLSSIGENCSHMKQFGDAEDYLEQALALYRKSSNGVESEGSAHAQRIMARLYMSKGLFDKAEEYYRQSLFINLDLPQHADDSDIPETLYEIAWLYRGMERYSEACDFDRWALVAFRDISHDTDSIDIANTLRNLGYDYCGLKNRQGAITALGEAKEMYNRLDPCSTEALEFGELLVALESAQPYLIKCPYIFKKNFASVN